ncbi:hypothetical protein FRX31_015184, partial [Thalictrum thalictroides]
KKKFRTPLSAASGIHFIYLLLLIKDTYDWIQDLSSYPSLSSLERFRSFGSLEIRKCRLGSCLQR